jgi:hypothetical protein
MLNVKTMLKTTKYLVVSGKMVIFVVENNKEEV